MAIDKQISTAWLMASFDLGIDVTAPFTLTNNKGEEVKYEAHIKDFGKPMGTVVGSIGDEDLYEINDEDVRNERGFYVSNLADRYKIYNRQLFIDTLNDWMWFGEKGKEPSWYTGKPWTE